MSYEIESDAHWDVYVGDPGAQDDPRHLRTIVIMPYGSFDYAVGHALR